MLSPMSSLFSMSVILVEPKLKGIHKVNKHLTKNGKRHDINRTTNGSDKNPSDSITAPIATSSGAA